MSMEEEFSIYHDLPSQRSSFEPVLGMGGSTRTAEERSAETDNQPAPAPSHQTGTGDSIHYESQDSRARRTVYVCNLTWWTTDEQLEQLFSAFGGIEDVFFVEAKETGKSLGAASIVMATPQQAAEATTKLNGTVVHEQPMNVVLLSDLQHIAEPTPPPAAAAHFPSGPLPQPNYGGMRLPTHYTPHSHSQPPRSQPPHSQPPHSQPPHSQPPPAQPPRTDKAPHRQHFNTSSQSFSRHPDHHTPHDHDRDHRNQKRDRDPRDTHDHRRGGRDSTRQRTATRSPDRDSFSHARR